MTGTFNPLSLPIIERLQWQERLDWQQGRVTHSSLIIVLALWGFGIVWCAAISFIFHVNRAKIEAALAASWTEWIVPGLLVLVAVGVIWSAIGATISWKNNGRSALVIETLPAFVGETFRGRIEAGDILLGKRSFKLTLQCEEVKQHLRSVKGSRRKKHAHFYRVKLGSTVKTEAAVASPAASGLFSFPVEIAIPPSLPGTRREENGTGYSWTLTATSDDGTKPVFSAVFEIPVYRRRDMQAVEA
jgi:hypothetical protein